MFFQQSEEEKKILEGIAPQLKEAEVTAPVNPKSFAEQMCENLQKEVDSLKETVAILTGEVDSLKQHRDFINSLIEQEKQKANEKTA